MRTLLTLTVLIAVVSSTGGAQRPGDPDGVAALLTRIEQVALIGDREAFAALSDEANRTNALEFAVAEIPGGATRVVARERAREPLIGVLPGNGYRLSLDVF